MFYGEAKSRLGEDTLLAESQTLTMVCLVWTRRNVLTHECIGIRREAACFS